MTSNADEAIVSALAKTIAPVLEASMNAALKGSQTRQTFGQWGHGVVQVSREILEASENNTLLTMRFLEGYNGTQSFMPNEQSVSIFWVDSPFACCEMLSITLCYSSLQSWCDYKMLVLDYILSHKKNSSELGKRLMA